MNETTKQGKFLEAINRFAMERQKTLHDEVTAYKEERVEQATEEGLRDAHELIRREIAERKSRIVRETARFEQDERRRLFSTRSEMTDEIFLRAKERLLQYCATPEYKQNLLRSAAAVKKSAAGCFPILYLCERDQNYADEIKAIFKDCEIQYDDSICIGGLKAFCRETGVILDDTFDSKLSDERVRFIESAPMKVV